MLKTIMQEELRDKVSLESYSEEQRESDIVAVESLTGFLTGITKSFKAGEYDLNDLSKRKEKDGFFYGLFVKRLDAAFKDVIRNENATLRKVRTLEQNDLAKIKFLVPDRLSGNYNLLLEDLMMAYSGVIPLLKEVTTLFKKDIAVNIKLVSEGKFEAPVSIISARNLATLRETYLNKLSKFFMVEKPRSYSTAIEHFRSTTEVKTAFDQLHNLEAIYGDFRLSDVTELASSVTDLVRLYVEELRGLDKAYIKNNRGISQMTEVINEIAKSLELIGYLQSKVIQTYVSFKDLSDKVNAYK